MEKSKSTKNLAVIPISSSSSSSSSGEVYLDKSRSESDDSHSSSEFSVEEISSSTCCDDAENDAEEEQNERKDEDSICRQVVHLLRERGDLEELTLVECKAYLRRHGLRLSGTRAECVERIKEHWRIKDGRGDRLYPRSSFNIDCTGDVCRGDVVLFTQKVYKKFDRVTRGGRHLGKRTVAGRIVKESYGAAKQQHTFTVEVLWSKGIKELPPLFPLLVKGRNLYRMKTFRQRWKNERERSEVLSEKHKRGAAARQTREMRKTNSINRKRKRSSTDEGLFGKSVSKHQKRSLHSGIHERSQRLASKQENHQNGRGKDPAGKQRSNFSLQNGPPPLVQSNFQGKGKKRAPSTQWRHQKQACFSSSECSSASANSWLRFPSNPNPFLMPFSARQELDNYDVHPDYGCPTNVTLWRGANYFSGSSRRFEPFPYTHRRRR